MIFYNPASGLTVPLVTSETGNKYGKTAGNAVWLNEEQTSPFQLYQFLVRTKDSEVKKFLQIFTFLTTDEIEAVMRKHTVSFLWDCILFFSGFLLISQSSLLYFTPLLVIEYLEVS